jgi:hypothetical protein
MEALVEAEELNGIGTEVELGCLPEEEGEQESDYAEEE